ncbi:MAG: alcohol dehydrogenase family protein [Actinobacteria bacterium]|nr:alcohol dehydrogenase family protein [Actinomycetota bacterium]
MTTPLPSAMRAVLLTAHGGFECLEYRTDVAVPTPGTGEVLVNIAAAGINNTDINTRIGWYADSVADDDSAGWTGDAFTFPRIQGADGCGTVVAVGDGVDPSRVGQRVLIEPVIREPVGWALDQARYFGSECDGAFADYATVPSAHAHRINSDLTDAQLASFPCAYSAAETMLTRVGATASDTVLVTGASGGVGSAAVQLAKRRGCRVIAVAGADKLSQVAQLGADVTIARGTDLAAQCGRESVDVVIDVVGGDQWPQLLSILKRGGRYATAGAIAGPNVQLDLRTLYLKDLRLFGCTVLEPEVFANLIGYIERGEIKPLVAAQFALSDIVAAQQYFLSKNYFGKIVLVHD